MYFHKSQHSTTFWRLSIIFFGGYIKQTVYINKSQTILQFMTIMCAEIRVLQPQLLNLFYDERYWKSGFVSQ